ncbi:MAG: cyclic nucleotide-binding domain-containing protein [Deltaproteobacteria bacterium]|nr:cyclic nucleotide-binding domain-containing protein [Deltaproteobacteria bacterium]
MKINQPQLLETQRDVSSDGGQGSPKVTSDENAQKVRALSQIELFRGIRSAVLRKVAAIAEQESFEAGQLIFREGELGDKVYLVLEGKVRISRQIPGIGEETIALFERGASFGEMALFDDFPRSADAWAHERCVLLSISREALEELLFLDKDLAYEILWNAIKIMSARLRETNDKLIMLSVSSKF